MWVGIDQSVEGLSRKQEICLQNAFRPSCNVNSSLGPQLAGLPFRFRTCQPPYTSQFLKINQRVCACVCAPCWFCFSGEP